VTLRRRPHLCQCIWRWRILWPWNLY